MLTATLAEPQVVLLKWEDNSTGEAGFLVERQAGAGEFREVGRVAANVKEYRDTTVSKGREYFYRVAAFDGQAKASGFTEEVPLDVP